ncbi:hypothetical protein [Flavobacterium hercynium]|uniref:Uncharacterized protein n=1 Tax=Flavobacterium hercynium TaxID=387094 RepID=A0A226HIK8_9FLAO|nr:hypothetical protein [Flavobacterium hercynium]OXA94093.1 hypothetical protein B0A66_05280 [Flavobacterium hercynium]SMP33123.1 hypothetical protein SAMN06265346_11632 [Flavobacterium hercynium]
MSQKLRIIPKMPLVSGQTYDESMGCLTLSSCGTFTVEIVPSECFHENVPKPLPPFRELTPEEVLDMPDKGDRIYYVERHTKRKLAEKKYEEDVAAYDKQIKEELATLSWCWEVVGNGMKNKIMKHNPNLSIGIPKHYQKDFNFPKLLVGGGFAWVEAFTDNDPAIGDTPFGLYVCAKGTPQIINVVWTDFKGNPITTTVKFGSKILLNIYTIDMFGVDLTVTLWDKDKYKPNDTKPDGKMESFECEVLTAELKENEEGIKGVSGGIKIDGESQTHVQKAQIPVLIDHDWMFDGGRCQGILLTAECMYTEKKYPVPEHKQLLIAWDGEKYEQKRKPVNNVAFIGKVETFISSFRPCRYDKIELKKQGKAGGLVLFDSAINKQRAITNFDVEIIAGKKEKYILDIDFHSLDCNTEPTHHNNEIAVLAIPLDYELQPKAGSRLEHLLKKEEKPLFTSSSSHSSSLFGFNSTQKEVVSKETGIVAIRENQVEFDAFFNYDIPQDENPMSTFMKAMQYCSLSDLSQSYIKKISIRTDTCAFQQDINIAIYPDIKWTLKVGFNVEANDIEKLNRKGGTFAPLKTFQHVADEKDKANFEVNESNSPKVNNENQRRKETLDRAAKHFTDEYQLKPKQTAVAPVSEGTSFKEVFDILRRMTLSFGEEHYGGAVQNELTDKFARQMYECYKSNIDLVKNLISIFDGTFDQKPFNPKDEKDIDGLMGRLQRKPVEYKMLYPKIAAAASWSCDPIDGKKHPELKGRLGVGVDLQLKATPLLGVAIQWDLLELLCRRHPIAYAVLKAIDGLTYILADDQSAVNLNFVVSGQIDTTIDFQYNKLAGFKEFHKAGRSSIRTAIEFKINISNKYKTLGYETIASFEYNGTAEAVIGVKDWYGIDENGFFVKTKIEFEGIKLSFSATGTIFIINDEYDKKQNKPILDAKKEYKGDITFLQWDYQTDKIYLLS